jgi:hypothetical protein
MYTEEDIEIAAAWREVEAKHACKARYAGKQKVDVSIGCIVLNDGDVYLFELLEHPKTKLCYAWTYFREGVRHIRTVLKIHPVLNATDAIWCDFVRGLEERHDKRQSR